MTFLKTRLTPRTISTLAAFAAGCIVLVTAASGAGTAPLPPTSLSATASTASSISIAWAAPSDPTVVRYRYFLDGTLKGAVSALQQTIAGLNCGTTYTLGVASLDASEASSPPVTTSATTSPCATPPANQPTEPASTSPDAPAATTPTSPPATAAGPDAPTETTPTSPPATAERPTAGTGSSTSSGSSTTTTTPTLALKRKPAKTAVAPTKTKTTTTTTTSTTTSSTGTYYVSSTGNDASSGTSSATAWRTIAKANAAVKPGDTVVLSGNFSQQAIAPSRSGTATAQITYRAGSAGATLDLPGLVSATPYLAYFGGKSYVTVDGVSFSNSNYVNAPVINKGVVLRGASHITLTHCSFSHVQVQVYASDDNTITNNTFRYFVASYVNPATGKPDPNHPNTAGDMLNIFGGSDRNLVQYNDMKYAGHSLIEVGSGNGASDVNSANVISDNLLSNPWYKPLILSDDGSGTIVERNTISDASTQPTLYSTVPSEGGAINAASAGVQFSGQNFILRNNTFVNNNAVYGVITLGARWYFDANHPSGVLVESLNNQIYGNVVYGNHAAASVSFVLFMTPSDVQAGRSVPRLTANVVKNNIFWGNGGTSSSWNNSTAYSTFIYHSATMAPVWPAGTYNGNKVSANDFDNSSAANLTDVTYGTKSTHVLQSLSTFQSYSAGDVGSNLSVNPMFTNPTAGVFTVSSASPVKSFGT